MAVQNSMGGRRLLAEHEAGTSDSSDSDSSSDSSSSSDDFFDVPGSVSMLQGALSECKEGGATLPTSTVDELYGDIAENVGGGSSGNDDDSNVAFGLAAAAVFAAAALA